MSARAAAARSIAVGDDLQWYKDAIIYELHVRAFQDGNGDGIGDFRGLTRRLDYIRDLGVTAIWLLPFYVSPLRDDGYDIADFRAIHPAYGTVADFRAFLTAAHHRGLRVITELVLNHTSDQHAWFQRARRAPKGHPWRDYYVWSDTATEYATARIIFKDFERSNWTWDPVAGQHYWHRFYSHQPDLNYDNPRVRKEVFGVMDFWLKMGVDGFRLDAVPYLFEREGTSCENLPETHEFLRELRAHIDEHYPGRMLLAEANQWPEDAARYFGDGDECHMAYHFPLMPRLFMAARMEDRFPVTEILEQTPAIPESAQWALFLRNHDELTLEMVTDEERDYMYRVYADEERARINLGIRRRLAPLLGHNRRLIELMYALLFSLEGTPVIYYGDEIGMGDNIYLGDRDSVRTPMQWSGERNAGFSTGNPQRLYLPVVTDPEYHYESVNVEAQQANPSLLLWWMRRIMSLRKGSKALSRGSITMVDADNRRVLAFVREFQDEQVLVVANLSRFTQGTHLNLASRQGMAPVEMFGQARFPVIGDAPYFLSLGPHTFFWFKLEPAGPGELPAESRPLVLGSGESWEALFGARRPALERVLASYLPARRWFGSKTRDIQRLRLHEVMPFGRRSTIPAALVVLRVEYVEGEAESFALLLAAIPADRAAVIDASAPWASIAPIEEAGHPSLRLVDGLAVPEVALALLGLLKARIGLEGSAGGQFKASSRPALRAPGADLTPALQRNEQSNTSVSYGDRFMLKFIRKVEPGPHPQVEIEEFLADSSVSAHVPRMLATAEYRNGSGKASTIALVENLVPHVADGWRFALDELNRFLEGVASAVIEAPAVPADAHPLDVGPPPQALAERASGWLELATTLGRRTAELHSALAAAHGNPAFEPEPVNPFYQRAVAEGFRVRARTAVRTLRQVAGRLDEPSKGLAAELLALEPQLLARFQTAGKLTGGLRIRQHGDLHLGQVLITGVDCVFIDFEGEPARSLGDRRIKRSPMRDVAGMLRSFSYAAQFALRMFAPGPNPDEHHPVVDWVRAWSLWTSSTYMKAYLGSIQPSSLLPEDPAARRQLLDAFVLDKALYEVIYELDNRPAWVDIPLRAILETLTPDRPGADSTQETP